MVQVPYLQPLYPIRVNPSEYLNHTSTRTNTLTSGHGTSCFSPSSCTVIDQALHVSSKKNRMSKQHMILHIIIVQKSISYDCAYCITQYTEQSFPFKLVLQLQMPHACSDTPQHTSDPESSPYHSYTRFLLENRYEGHEDWFHKICYVATEVSKTSDCIEGKHSPPRPTPNL